jgi:hypothetical protein
MRVAVTRAAVAVTAKKQRPQRSRCCGRFRSRDDPA